MQLTQFSIAIMKRASMELKAFPLLIYVHDNTCTRLLRVGCNRQNGD